METPFARPYTIHIQGPDMDIRFYVQDEHDLKVLDLILIKIRKKGVTPTADHSPSARSYGLNSQLLLILFCPVVFCTIPRVVI